MTRPPAPPRSTGLPHGRQPAGNPAADDPTGRCGAGVRLLAELRIEVARADTKAGVLAGVLGITAAALGSLPAGREGFATGPPAPAALLWWAGGAAHVVALLALLLVVVPRHSQRHWRPGAPLTYFADIHRAHRRGHLSTALRETARDPDRALLIALAETSRIAARKTLWFRAGLVAFGSSSVLLPAALLLS